MDAATGKLYMLEVNAQCGLSEDENYTSIGAILKVSDKSFTEIIVEILKDALRRSISQPAVIKKIQHIQNPRKQLPLNKYICIFIIVLLLP